MGDGIAAGCGLQIPAEGQGTLWVPAHCEEFTGLLRIDTENNSIAEKISVGSVPSSAKLIGGVLWIADAGGSLFRIDPTQNKTIGSMIPVNAEAIDLTYSHGSVWVSNYNGTVYRIESD